MRIFKNLFHTNAKTGSSIQEENTMTNIEKATALINTFAAGDTAAAKSLLAGGYIQHNLAYGTGAGAFIAPVEYLVSAPVKTTVQNIRAFADGGAVFRAYCAVFGKVRVKVLPAPGSLSNATWAPR